MADNVIKIVIDTNLWVSWLLNSRTSMLSNLLANESVEVLSSSALEAELFEVLNRPKFSNRLSTEQILQFKSDFNLAVFQVEVLSTIEAAKDPKDNFLLALAKDGTADYLLTGDIDLLSLDSFEDTQILTIRAFMERFNF